MKKSKYQEEYEKSEGCFWLNKPAKFVKYFQQKIKNSLENYNVLDLGAGEGKNAVYLASKGAKVIAVDISDIALSRFNKQPNFNLYKNNITIIQKDIRSLYFEKDEFDLIVAYGIFHALDNIHEIYQLFDESIKWLNTGGYYIIATFTDKIPPPSIQNYLEYSSFLNYNKFIKYISKYEIIKEEHDIITETHPTSKIEHQHSIVRVLLRKI